jgi:hypothetical protein
MALCPWASLSQPRPSEGVAVTATPTRPSHTGHTSRCHSVRHGSGGDLRHPIHLCDMPQRSSYKQTRPNRHQRRTIILRPIQRVSHEATVTHEVPAVAARRGRGGAARANGISRHEPQGRAGHPAGSSPEPDPAPSWSSPEPDPAPSWSSPGTWAGLRAERASRSPARGPRGAGAARTSPVTA